MIPTLFRRGGACCLFFLLATLPPMCACADTSPVEEATSILERWTTFHWGRDCIVWVVHYPEELVTPWVEAEASRSGMSQEEKDNYRRSFVKELRIAETEPFLLTVYAFGPKPLALAPLSSSVLLSLPDGRSVAPVSYEKKFDEPLSGVVQGLVFFPKQPDKRFVVTVRGLGIRREQEFAFGVSAVQTEGPGIVPEEGPGPKDTEPSIAAKSPGKGKGTVTGGNREGIVVSLPPAPKSEKKAPVVPERPERPLPPVPPTPPLPEPSATPVPALVGSDDVALAAFRPDSKKLASGDVAPQDPSSPETRKKDTKNVYRSKEKALEAFLSEWIAGDAGKMHSLLSEPSAKTVSVQALKRDTIDTPMRWALKDGYKIKWLDGNRAKVIASQKFILMRTLVSRVVTLAQEGHSWSVVW
jgi:hypothetical protein